MPLEDADLRPITFSDGKKSISDDDLCAGCSNCDYCPGEMSSCKAGWPGLEDRDGYVQQCAKFANESVIDKLCKAADNHGADAGEADHTVGDLQGLLRLCWRLMTSDQKQAFVASPEVEEVVDLGAREEYSVEDLLAEVEQEDR